MRTFPKHARRPAFLPDEVQEILAAYKDGESTKSMAARWGGEASVYIDVLRTNGVEVLTHSQRFARKADYIVQEYQKGRTSRSICDETKSSSATVLNLLRQRGIPIRDSGDYGADISDKHAEITRRYMTGEGAGNLAKEFHVSIRKIHEIVAAQGGKKRSFREAHCTRIKERSHIPVGAFGKWKHNAFERGYEWSVSYQDLEVLYAKQCGLCYYTGVPLFTEKRANKIAHLPESISLDRLDSAKGYTVENSVLCCRAINLAKNQWSTDQFSAFLAQVAACLPARLNLATSGPEAPLNPSQLFLAA